MLYIGLIALLWACSCESAEEPGVPVITCTTGMLGDAVQKLIGNAAKVQTLMGPGVDPHLYKASQGDIRALSQAKVIVYNGLHLEGKMGEIFSKLSANKRVIAAAEALPQGKLINATGYNNAYDPHVWFDVRLWSHVVQGLSYELQKAFPDHADDIASREKTYLKELETLDDFCRTSLSKIPDNQRVLITAHDAFKYFGQAYNIEVRGLQGISTTAEYGLQDVSELVRFIVARKIKAIFVESSVSTRSIEAVLEGCRAQGHEVKLGGELFSDALGEAGSPEGTYVGMVRHNVQTISTALQ